MATTTPGMGFTARKRQRALVPNLTLVCILLATIFVPQTKALVSVEEFGENYISLPARFGGQLSAKEDDPPIRAYLTLVKDQPYMCSDELKNIQPMPPFVSNLQDTSSSSNNNSTAMEATKAPANSTLDASMNIDKNDLSFVTEIANEDITPLPPPNTDLPVALLVERGMCTFFEKAVMASAYGSFIKYVIIYDDQIAPDLVPMSSEYDTDMTLLFVSATTGRALKNHVIMSAAALNQQQWQQPIAISSSNNNTSNVDSEDDDDATAPQDDRFFGYNLVIKLDGTSPYFQTDYRGLNMAAYFLAAMSGFLAFLIFFGCLLICAQCGCITAAPDEHGRIVLFTGGPGIRPPEGLARMIRVDKLTRDQVMLLDEEDFEPETTDDDDTDEAACCAICLEEFEHHEKVRVLPCGHKFHEDCLIPWLTERHASCPLCKMDVLKHIKELEAKQQNGSGGNAEKTVDDGEEEDSASAHTTQSASSPRSFWYRLRGWSLVDGTPTVASEAPTNASSSLSVSEIEMETWTSTSSATQSAGPVAAEEP